MDAEGGRVVQRERRARKLAVVVAVQNVLLAACLLVTLYVYWGVQPPDDNVHIEFETITDKSGSTTLQFKDISSQSMMYLIDNKINVTCTGPYVLYMDVCYRSLSKNNVTGVLTLQVEGRTAPAASFALHTSDEACRGLHGIAYLRAREQVSVQVSGKDEFKIKTVTLGLTYLLRQCRS